MTNTCCYKASFSRKDVQPVCNAYLSACFSTWIYMSLKSLKSVSAWRGIRWLTYVFSVRIVITPNYCYNYINYIHLKWCITIVELSNWFTSRLLHQFTVHALKAVISSLDKPHLSHYQILDEIFWWKKDTFTKDTIPIKLNFEKQYFAVKLFI